MTLDDLRIRFPALAFALYALEPIGAVTFEIIEPDGATYTFTGDTAAAAVAKAFPPEPAPGLFD